MQFYNNAQLPEKACRVIRATAQAEKELRLVVSKILKQWTMRSRPERKGLSMLTTRPEGKKRAVKRTAAFGTVTINSLILSFILRQS